MHCVCQWPSTLQERPVAIRGWPVRISKHAPYVCSITQALPRCLFTWVVVAKTLSHAQYFEEPHTALYYRKHEPWGWGSGFVAELNSASVFSFVPWCSILCEARSLLMGYVLVTIQCGAHLWVSSPFACSSRKWISYSVCAFHLLKAKTGSLFDSGHTLYKESCEIFDDWTDGP